MGIENASRERSGRPGLAIDADIGYGGDMKVAKLAELRDSLSRYVHQVEHGATVRILVRGRPVADLVPVRRSGSTTGADDWNLDELERRGMIRRGDGRIPPELFKPGPKARGKGVSEALLEERRQGR